jgi:hypothetical protein
MQYIQDTDRLGYRLGPTYGEAMADAVPLNHFARGKPFYPIIMNYLQKIVGFTELTIRAFAGPRHLDDIKSCIIAREGATGAAKSDPIVLQEHFRKITNSLQLRSEFSDHYIEISIDLIASEIT